MAKFLSNSNSKKTREKYSELKNVQGSYPASAKSSLKKYFKADWCFKMCSSRSSRKGETPRMIVEAVGQGDEKHIKLAYRSNFGEFTAVPSAQDWQKEMKHGGGFLKVCGCISAKRSWRFGQNSLPMPRTTRRHISIVPYHQGDVSVAPSLFCRRTMTPKHTAEVIKRDRSI